MSLLQQLPEVIEQIGRDIKAITVVLGSGRPDNGWSLMVILV